MLVAFDPSSESKPFRGIRLFCTFTGFQPALAVACSPSHKVHMPPVRSLCWVTLLFALAIPCAQAQPEAFEVGPKQTDQLPKGKEADGIIGDFILRNDKIDAVISGNLPNRRANMSTFYGAGGVTPGCLYDLTPRGANNDQITIYSPGMQQGPVSWVRIAKDGSDGEAVIETATTGANNGGLSKRHEYRLRDGWQGVLVTTTFRNESDGPVKTPTTDRWTNFKRSGTALGFDWADAIDPADKAGYAVADIEGEQFTKVVSVELKPGQEAKFSRFIAVGSSSLEAVGIAAAQRGQVGRVQGTVRDANGAGLTTGEITARAEGGAGRVVGVGYPGTDGAYSFALPPGDWELTYDDQGRAPIKKQVSVAAGTQVTADVAMAVASSIDFSIRDEAGRSTPCKVQFHATGDTTWPYLGPENRAHGCVDQWHSEKGDFRVQIAPGTYRVVVTRGIEYSHLEQQVKVEAGSATRITGTLKRLVDTRGWVSADYHNHSTPSGDNTCGTDDRLINLAAEHIEFAPTTEHNRLYDWRPHIESLGLGDYLQTVPGMELTGAGTHFNSFPFKPEPFTQDNGAPVWNKDPRITGITLRDWQGSEPDRWVQINHPDMVENFIDRNADGQADGGFLGLASLIDGIETQNYSASEILGERPFRIGRDKLGKETLVYLREFIWLQMLNRGHRYAAVAVCDAHSVYGNGVGGWRMFMPSSTDEPAKIDWRENSRHAKAGRSILTTGPYLSVTTDRGDGPGESVRAAGGVKLNVRVQCTEWIDIDRVQVLVNGRPRADLNFTRKSHPKMFADGVVKFEQTLDVPLSEDAHLIVVATGENFTLAKGYGTSAQAKIKPIAYNNPIFVDVDGGGFTPNGDLLGWPLPVKKLSIDDAKKMLQARGKPDSAEPLVW
jgi:hypothetical protein